MLTLLAHRSLGESLLRIPAACDGAPGAAREEQSILAPPQAALAPNRYFAYHRVWEQYSRRGCFPSGICSTGARVKAKSATRSMYAEVITEVNFSENGSPPASQVRAACRSAVSALV